MLLNMSEHHRDMCSTVRTGYIRWYVEHDIILIVLVAQTFGWWVGTWGCHSRFNWTPSRRALVFVSMGLWQYSGHVRGNLTLLRSNFRGRWQFCEKSISP